MKKRIVIIIGCLILCMSMGGCAYLAAERNGAMFPSTREFWCGREDGKRYDYVYPFLPTVGLTVCCAGYIIPYVGPLVSCPAGLAIHAAEGCAMAPAYDILCMPYDLCKRPGYLEECRRSKANRSQPKAPAEADNLTSESTAEGDVASTNEQGTCPYIQTETKGRMK